MFLGSVIYDKRRSLNLTQNDLANGVCNQNTISKMEKHNMTPQIDVLIKICHRLDLSLNDVFSDFSSDSKQEQIFVLDSIEENVLLNDISEIDTKLSLVKDDINSKDMAQFSFIEGVLQFWQSNLERSSFELDKVVKETKSDNDNIYTLMAYLIKAMIYLKQNHPDMAAYYCKTIADSLQENLNIANAQGIEILFICKSLGKIYADLNQIDLAIEISKRGIKYANEKHLSYFIDELNYNIALALKPKGTDNQEFQKYQKIAYYSAISLNHESFQKKIEKELLNK
ncbi:helix-turn-helix domain-containing protein [Companilactobacillus nantensis]|uniref:HTH cro/C1-type domain-containing protein n=1 Tax=Companilactobacillus nantensis DSM 16982 TaxID=1423774 RepID=A0A0R1WEQ4_9LACO|nr:helix-turn-helix transcriptional regulator [Companilactobacillus nantensis]KRM16077.1 hypothetical protein FD31_GL000752 [Companilactobacillus nantensis DSM 16982]GEO63867.1 transcriptional regulator [Companilactobacillus nantensis]